MFWDNFGRRITAVAVQLNHAESKGISTTARSSYYRSAIILVCTLVEAAVYQLVKETTNPENIVKKHNEHKELFKLPPGVVGTTRTVYVCERIPYDVRIDDNGVDFSQLNLYLKNHKIITFSQYRMLEVVRKERNKIHLQGLSFHDTGYTKKKFNTMSKPMDFLLDKLSS